MQTNEPEQIDNPPTAHASTHKHSGDEHNNHSIVVYCDGAGSRPDGKGSGFAWIEPKTRRQHVERIDGLTNNQAEYRAFISVLTILPVGSTARVFTDSQLLWSHVIGNYKVRHPDLAELLQQVRTLIKEKNLRIDLQWVPRERNLAGKLL